MQAGRRAATMEWITILYFALLGFISALFLYKYSAKRRRFVALINLLPGPPSYPVVGSVLELMKSPRNELVAVGARHAKQYGPIYRSWGGPIGEVHINRPECFEAIISGMKHIEKGWSYGFLHPWLSQGLLTSSGSKWHSRRKIITPTFHFKILETFVNVFAENSQILVEKLQQQMEVDGVKGFDVFPFISRCALDIICETAMGVKIHAQEEVHSDYMQAVHESSQSLFSISGLTLQRAFRPWLFIDFIFNLSSIGKRYNQCLQVLHGFTKKVIQERKNESSKDVKKITEPAENDDHYLGIKTRMAFLDLLLEASCDGSVLTDHDIQEEVDTFMFEGHDTTTAAVGWALFFLGLNPDVQEKAFEELDSIFKESDRPVTLRDCQEMKYLERVIKEVLRLCPSVPFIIRNLEEDTECGGYTLPEGATVFIHIYHAHRAPEHFPNPDKFDPDNFLPERVQGRHPYAYIPFSAGPRNCIGQKFAILEEKIVLATILRRFKLRSLEKLSDMKISVDLVLRPDSGVKMVLTRR